MFVNLPNLLMLLGIAHGALLSLLLVFTKRHRNQANYLLAGLLILYTLPLLKVTLLDLGFSPWSKFGIQRFGPWPMELLFGLGPSLYLYAKMVREPVYQLSRKDSLHFLPALLEILYYVSPLYRPSFLHGSLAPTGESTSPLQTLWVMQQLGAILSIIIYLALTNHLLWSYAKWVRAEKSEIHQRTLRWLQTPVLLYSVFFVLWLGLRATDVLHFNDGLPQKAYYPLLLFLSMSTYWIGTKGFLESGYLDSRVRPRGDSIGRSDQDPDRSSSTLSQDTAEAVPARLQEEASAPTREEIEAKADLEGLFQDVEQVMSEQHPYLRNDLGLPELAGILGINPRLLSKVINTQAGVNFYDYVNRYRIAAFQAQVAKPDEGRSLLDLAFACGFGSKATFNHVFKKETGLTPSQYRRQALESSDPSNQPSGSEAPADGERSPGR